MHKSPSRRCMVVFCRLERACTHRSQALLFLLSARGQYIHRTAPRPCHTGHTVALRGPSMNCSAYTCAGWLQIPVPPQKHRWPGMRFDGFASEAIGGHDTYIFTQSARTCKLGCDESPIVEHIRSLGYTLLPCDDDNTRETLLTNRPLPNANRKPNNHACAHRPTAKGDADMSTPEFPFGGQSDTKIYDP